MWTRSFCLALMWLSGSLGGCRGDEPKAQPQPTTAPAMETTWQSAPLPVTSEAVAVKEGNAPLVYMTEGPGVFRVVDRTTNVTLAEAFAQRQTIVRVDERNGVLFGMETLAKGPLVRGHKYAFYLLPEGANVARQGVFRPKAQ